MLELKQTPILDKDKLVEKIKEKFLNLEQYKYFRTIAEFTNNEEKFIGDVFMECTFKLIQNDAPVIYEFTSPYDVASNTYAGSARVYHKGNILYQFAHGGGVAQRTAAMTWAYIKELDHKPTKIIFYGPGNVSSWTLEYIKYFMPELNEVDYYYNKGVKQEFEDRAKFLGVKANSVNEPDVSKYDTIIMAKNSGDYLLNLDDINKIQKGALVISLSTTGTADINPEAYSADVNLFLDYDRTKKLFTDIKTADEKSYIKNEIYFSEVLKKGKPFDKDSKVNIIRLTGTPIQNIAMVEMVLDIEGVQI